MQTNTLPDHLRVCISSFSCHFSWRWSQYLELNSLYIAVGIMPVHLFQETILCFIFVHPRVAQSKRNLKNTSQVHIVAFHLVTVISVPVKYSHQRIMEIGLVNSAKVTSPPQIWLAALWLFCLIRRFSRCETMLFLVQCQPGYIRNAICYIYIYWDKVGSRFYLRYDS